MVLNKLTSPGFNIKSEHKAMNVEDVRGLSRPTDWHEVDVHASIARRLPTVLSSLRTPTSTG